MTSRRRGFALLVVLWLVTLLGILAGTALLSARVAISAGRNRVVLRRAAWARDACLSLLLANTDGHTVPEPIDSVDLGGNIWCRARVEPGGGVLNVNLASEHQLTLVLQDKALVSALLDWRDVDDSERPEGAERRWYVNAGRAGPRNGPLHAIAELLLVRGFDETMYRRVGPMLTVAEGTSLSLATAPLELLAGLPGMTTVAIDALRQARVAGHPIHTIDELLAIVPQSERFPLAVYYAELLSATTDANTFVVDLEGVAGRDRLRAGARVTLQRAGDHVAVAAQETR